MADEKSLYFREDSKTPLSHSTLTTIPNDEIEDEDEVSLPLSDEELLSLKPWERTERESILQIYKDMSHFSCDIDSLTGKDSSLRNHDTFSAVKSKRISTVSEIEDEEKIEEIIGIHSQGENFSLNDPCPVDYCLNAREVNTSPFNFYKVVSSKSETLSSSYDYQRFKDRKTSDNLIEVSDKKCRGYYGVENLNIKQTIPKIDKHGLRESSTKESGLSYNSNFLFNTKAGELYKSTNDISDKKKESLPRFWWLNTYGKPTNEDVNYNAARCLKKEIDNLSKDSTCKSGEINYFHRETTQLINHSHNLLSNKNYLFPTDSSSTPFLSANSNQLSSESNPHNCFLFNKNNFGKDGVWWKDVKRVNLPDSPYGFTQRRSEMTVKNIYQDISKLKHPMNIKENDSPTDAKVPECAISGNDKSKTSLVHGKDLKESEMRIIIKSGDLPKDINDKGISEEGDTLLNKSTIEPNTMENRTVTNLGISDHEETIVQDEHPQFKIGNLHENLINRAMLEDQETYDEMPILISGQDKQKEHKVDSNRKMEDWNHTLRKLDQSLPEEYNITDQEKSVFEKCKGFESSDFSHENLTQNEKKETNNYLENREFSTEYDNMLVSEAIKIENEVISDIKGEILSKQFTGKVDEPLKVYTGNGCKKDCRSKKMTYNSKATEVKTSIEPIKEVNLNKDNFIKNLDEKEVKEITVECPAYKEFKEAEECSLDKLVRDELKDSNNYCNSDINAFHKHHTLSVEDEDFNSKPNETFEKNKESLDKNILNGKKMENEANDLEKNPMNERMPETFIKFGCNSSIYTEKTVVGIKPRHEIDDKCDYLHEKDQYCLNSVGYLEKDMYVTQPNREVSLEIAVFSGEQIISPDGEVHALKLYDEKPIQSVNYYTKPFDSENNGKKTFGLDCEKVLDIHDYLLSEVKDHVYSEKEILEISTEEDIISEDVVLLNNQGLANVGLKNFPSSEVLQNVISSTNSRSLAFEQNKITIDALLELNTNSLIESSSEIKHKQSNCDSTETLKPKQDPDENHCATDDHIEDFCCELQNQEVVKESDILSSELQRKILNHLHNKELNDWIIKMKGNTRGKDLYSLNACVQEKNESSNTAMKINSQIFCSPMNWNSILMKYFMNIQFQNIKIHGVTNPTLKRFIYNLSKEKINNFHFDNDNQEIRTQDKTASNSYEDVALNSELIGTGMIYLKKLDRSLNEDPFNFAKVVELDYHKDLVCGYKSSKTAETNTVGDCKKIEKWFLDIGECHNDLSAELCIDSKTNDHYNLMLTNVSLRTNESLIDVNLGIDENSYNEKATLWRKSEDCEIQNNSFESDIKYKELKECTGRIDEHDYIPLHQEYKKNHKEDQENVLLSDKTFSCLSSLDIMENLNLIEDPGYPFNYESLYGFNPCEDASVAEPSQDKSAEDDTSHSKFIGSASLIESVYNVSPADNEKHEDYQTRDYKESLDKISETDDEFSLSIHEDDSNLSISIEEKIVKEEILKYKINFDMEDDDTSLDSYLSAIIDKHCDSEKQTHLFKCDYQDCKKLAVLNAECQTKISGLSDKFHTRTCVDRLILSANEHEICNNYGNKRSIEALNLEVARSKRLKYMDSDNSNNLSYDKRQAKEDADNQTKKRTSNELNTSLAEKEDSLFKKIKVNVFEESVEEALQLSEDEWSEVTNQIITVKESLDQKVPDVTPMIRCQGNMEEDPKECLKKSLCEENYANISEVPSIPKVSQRTSVLRLGLSKRVRPRPLHKVQ